MPGLNAATVGSLSGDVAVPTYDRDQVSTGIVHFGVGGFHRAHEAMYVDRLLNAGAATTWAICGIGVLPRTTRGASRGCNCRRRGQH